MSERKYFYPGVIRRNESGEYLIAGKCPVCGNVAFPKDKTCCRCLNENMEEIILNSAGTLVSYTTTYMPVQRFEPPHSVGYIQLSEDVRIFAPLIPDPERPFRVGQKMKMEICEFWKDEEGNSVAGYKFRPTEDKEAGDES